MLLDVWSAPSKRVQDEAELTTDDGYNGRGASFPEGVQHCKVVGIEIGAYIFHKKTIINRLIKHWAQST